MLNMVYQEEEKRPKRRHKNQRPTCSHTQEFHKSTKLKAVVCMPRQIGDPRRESTIIFLLNGHSSKLIPIDISLYPID